MPPHAARYAALSRAMLDVLASYGYERVAPPLVEFEETLTRRSGDGGRNGLLRVTDPVSGRTLAMRSDITKQVGRMAGSRLASARKTWLRLRMIATKNRPCADHPLMAAGEKQTYAEGVILDLDAWVLLPR